jgi:lambda repressor-like predicted transcriptional regulator
MTTTTQVRPAAAAVETIRKLRRMGFSVAGIAKQTGLSAEEVSRVLQEPHLMAQISRATAK